MKKYKYFEMPLKYADTELGTCDFCNCERECMDTVYFNRHDVTENLICFECFDKNLLSVEIPEYIKQELINNLKKYGITDIEQIEKKISDLSHTPPVPWIQNNEWPVCCGDFALYLGEWDRNEFENHGDGKKLLSNMLSDDDKKKYDIDYLWDNIGDWCCAFIFKCINCDRLIAVCQEY